MFSSKGLIEMSKMSFQDIDQSEIIEYNDIDIDTNLAPEKRIENYLRIVKNPYFIKVGDTIIKMSYSDNNCTLQELLTDVLIRKKAQ